ncbi:hypothetical protein D9756_000018 [Leucocoprinus leucothites]|uniref:Peptidase M20 dimerisation domain-containing protein n=1 Tax=Leucocoprinus leucothites TaxID=201217 RepID=A0A8H5LNA5_9AGAR|nr:hypothetical protein D9756_000018 [Leucoagaricus leucothites]
MGHLDVVPAVTSLDGWTFSPFSGKIADGWVHGRGSSDCKNNVIGILSAVEHLVENNWIPRRTILLGFGQDEEIGGHIGLAIVVDEGGMEIQTLYGTDFALVGVAEKGALNAYISIDMPGGRWFASLDALQFSLTMFQLIPPSHSHLDRSTS